MSSGKTIAQDGQVTSKVRTGHDIDLAKLHAYLAPHLPDLQAPLKVAQFQLGQSNPTFLLTSATGAKYVVRKKPPGSLVSSTAHAVEREYRVIKALGDHTDIPVPKVFVLCQDNAVLGTPFYVMEFLKGRIFSNVSFPEIAREERDALWYEAVSVLARLHAVVPKDIGLDGYGASKDYYPRQFRSLTRISNAQAAVSNAKTGTSVGPIPRLEEMLTWFRANRPIDECTIVHGDYKIDNLVFHPTEARIIGILDWELSTLGHPLSDLANLLQPFSIPAGVMPTPAVGLRDVRPLPIPSESELELHYCRIAHRPYPIPSWDFARAFSFFRLSVICQGIAARVAHGQASSAEAATFARLFTPVAHLALEIVDDSTSAGSAKAKL